MATGAAPAPLRCVWCCSLRHGALRRADAAREATGQLVLVALAPMMGACRSLLYTGLLCTRSTRLLWCNMRCALSLMTNGACRDYVTFEFLQKSQRFTRHVLATATVANGQLMLFTIGAGEKRWPKIKDRLTQSVQSFKGFERY